MLDPFWASIFCEKFFKPRGTYHHLVLKCNKYRFKIDFLWYWNSWNLFQWQATINRVTVANIDNKHNKMKKTASVQSKITSTKHLWKIYHQEILWTWWCFWNSYFKWHLIYMTPFYNKERMHLLTKLYIYQSKLANKNVP